MVAELLSPVHQIIRIHGMQCPPTSPGEYRWKFHLVPAASSTSVVESPIFAKIRESSFMRAIIRLERSGMSDGFTKFFLKKFRWMFSMTFAASAVRMSLASYTVVIIP